MQILAVISSSAYHLLPKMLILGNNDKIIISNRICIFAVWLHPKKFFFSIFQLSFVENK